MIMATEIVIGQGVQALDELGQWCKARVVDEVGEKWLVSSLFLRVEYIVRNDKNKSDQLVILPYDIFGPQWFTTRSITFTYLLSVVSCHHFPILFITVTLL